MDIFVGNTNIISSLGFSTSGHCRRIKAGQTGVRIHSCGNPGSLSVPLSLIDTRQLAQRFQVSLDRDRLGLHPGPFTRLEKMHILSISEALKDSGINIRDSRTLLVLSTTKGNIDLLEKNRYPEIGPERLYLWKLAEVLRTFFGNPNKPLVVSNACISGVLALITGSRLIQAGRFDHVIVTGGDLVTEFVVSGFQSFRALSPKPCKPFDLSRDGLSLGEGCATVALSRDPSADGLSEKIIVAGGASSNDAHHISGPSRTGEGLVLAIRGALNEAALTPSDIDYLSAHGTATEYNDEMEARAFSRSGLESVPVNSFKGYFGHTLGAAGVIESALAIESLRKNELFRSAGFETPGTSQRLNVLTDHGTKEVGCCLKTASGFGGCNGAIVFKKM
ncbi:MAG: beta-ketoacyl synthase [Deltaproteobacteria bacterium]|nr:beta-ketoacyl synthase [Deltaproteobacteria bacterium]